MDNPQGANFRDYPHLAHVDPVLFDEVNAKLLRENVNLGRKYVDGQDPLVRVPRHRSRFPGRHVCCAYCGRQFIWGGHGIVRNLVCSGARIWRCWNSIAIDGPLAAAGVVAALAAELEGLAGIDGQLRDLVVRAADEGGADLALARAKLQAERADLDRRQQNLAAALAEAGPSPLILQTLSQLEAEGRDLDGRRRQLELRAGRQPQLPGSAAELRRLFEEKARSLPAESYEFGDLLRQITPEFRVHAVRLLDGGHLQPRAPSKLNLAGIVPSTLNTSLDFGAILRPRA